MDLTERHRLDIRIEALSVEGYSPVDGDSFADGFRWGIESAASTWPLPAGTYIHPGTMDAGTMDEGLRTQPEDLGQRAGTVVARVIGGTFR